MVEPDGGLWYWATVCEDLFMHHFTITTICKVVFENVYREGDGEGEGEGEGELLWREKTVLIFGIAGVIIGIAAGATVRAIARADDPLVEKWREGGVVGSDDGVGECTVAYICDLYKTICFRLTVQAWLFIIPEEQWFLGKITTSVTKGVLKSIQTNLSNHQKQIMRRTCFAHFLECDEIVVQPLLIHFFLLRQVYQPNPEELWFLVAGRYVGSVTHEDVKSTFISACQMPDLDLVEALPDHDVALIGILYFITAYLFPRDYKKVVDHYLFTLVEDFPALNSFSWGKLLFDVTLSSLKDGLSRRTTHYRLRGMLVAFQAWIYETFPGLDEVIVTKISTTHPRIKNWFANEQPSASKLEEPDCFKKPNMQICDLVPSEAEMAMPYMDGVQYNKINQLEFSCGSYRRKNRKRKSANPASMSGESVPLVMDIGVGPAHVADDDDDFVDPPRRCEVTSHQETPNATEGPLAPQHSPNEPQYHGTERSDQTKKINEIMKMQEQIKCDMTEIRTNMQFLSESVTAMISSTMDEILRLFNDRKSSPVKEFGDMEPAVVGGEESHVVEEVHKIAEVGN
ncbi:uncharacterized protein LOC111373162 [Olea europaea var. sylvestris]|uniref:uncharacterized protein LOC111373162 n=1 Tax=Olea europaea var. sylvestris TaxID=158386 RepID=UPI000C1CD088|nr:uncharacterized protein LOC111373162 [Olea europaea var. sylvestris]